ncbi:MAG: phytoene/squalene synthase family protein [Chitinophagales bacterium]|jgi:phytoene/squalene synthetase|nr:phytoene/squalene synthase family protein [Chitinophagales bacterium]
MKSLYDRVSVDIAKLTTKSYSTSFSIGIKLLDKSLRNHIYSIYGFVRVADEIVDSFHGYPQEEMLRDFHQQYHQAIKQGISANPILNAFQEVVRKFGLAQFVEDFLKSMYMDLSKKEYKTNEEYQAYIYGSADVVGLMCLRVFVNGEDRAFEELKDFAMKLGSAFQKINFLRDYQSDKKELGRIYFPNLNFNELNETNKQAIIEDIKQDLNIALVGIRKLPKGAKLGVFTSYNYYKALLHFVELSPVSHLLESRMRINNLKKAYILFKSYLKLKVNAI